ncbi:hypothetical protein MP228_005280 [Amoeboaphelidium protococcarum]|nr:hypothetical protein MP228_005280 [Amoeboaphelidium protococcarum]
MKVSDYNLFVQKLNDESTKTGFGMFLTFLMPVLVGSYGLYAGMKAANDPPSISTTSYPAYSKVYVSNFQCVAPTGCFVSLNYNGPASASCRQAIVEQASQSDDLQRWVDQQTKTVSNACSHFAAGENFRVPYCYTVDANDGLQFLWKKNQQCSNYGALGTKAADPNAQCQTAVQIQQISVNVQQKQTQSNWLPLFPGVYLMLGQEIVMNDKSVQAMQPVLVQDVFSIGASNMCCNAMSKSNCTQAIANDYYALNGSSIVTMRGQYSATLFRLNPSYDVISVTYSNIPLVVANAIGSIYSIVFVACSTLVLMYVRFFNIGPIQQVGKQQAQKTASI